MTLRVVRGLFRLWLVLSVLWIGGVAALTWWTLPVDICVTPPGGPHFCDENDVVGTGPNFDPPTNHPLSQVPQFDPSKPYRLPHDAERHAAIRIAAVLAFAPPLLILALGSALVWAFKGFSLTSKGADARSGRLNHPNRPYSEMLEAAQRKLSEAQFFHRRLVHERDGRLVESEAGAFRHHLSAFLSGGESVVYVLKNADLTKYTAWAGGENPFAL
jgi:hypothetical protein